MKILYKNILKVTVIIEAITINVLLASVIIYYCK
jgi:hypothetical protein